MNILIPDLLSRLMIFLISPMLKDKLLDAAIEQGSYNGHVYAIPYLNVSLAGIFYNKDMFERTDLKNRRH